MAILTKQALLDKLKEHLKDDTSDETLSLIEDVSDTINDYDTKTADKTDWKDKYEKNDKEWRQRYRDRFFHTNDDEEDEGDGGEQPPKSLTYDNLFKEENK